MYPLTREEAESSTKNQKPKLSCGIDGINNRIVKECHKELSKPIMIIINKSIESSMVPKLYKKARIIPLYKKGKADECGNYRPVSLLPALLKILEKAICSQLMNYLQTYNKLCSSQYDFRPKCQTSHVVHAKHNHTE